MSLKRPASTEGVQSDVAEVEAKLPRINWHYVLEPETSKQCFTDENSRDSIHTIQQEETDVVRDTSDTDTKSYSDWSSSCSSDDDFTVKVEYEVASLSERENPLGDGSLSSDTDDIVCAAAASVVNLRKDELSSFADNSGNSDSNTMFDPEIPRADYWTCLQCKNKNNNPLFRYCEKCFKLRRDFFPPRPRKKRRRRRNSNRNAPSLEKTVSTASTVSLSEASQENLDCQSAIAGPSNLHLDSGLGSSPESFSQDSKSEVDSQEVGSSSTDSLSLQTCITCMTNPKNGIFIHGKVGHVCCCYKCALKVWSLSGKCPICNCKVRSVLKVIVQ